MPVRCIDLSIAGEWTNDDELTEKIHAAFATQTWVTEVVVENVTPYGPDDDKPTTVDLGRIVQLVEAAGFPAYVEYTGGGTATIYASRERDDDAPGYCKRHLAGPYDDEIVDVAAGPGFFVGPNFKTRNPEDLPPGAYAHLSEFYIGPDGDPDPSGYEATLDDTAETLAAQIVRRLNTFPAINPEETR